MTRSMLKNFLKAAWRNLLKYKLFSAINILGLSIGMALSILILFFIQHEFSYDQWQPGQENVYRVYRDFQSTSGWKSAILPHALANAMVDEIPEVIAAGGVRGFYEGLVTIDGKSQYLSGIGQADSLLLQSWPITFSQGDPATALEQPNTAVLSARGAELLFGKENPLGKTIRLDNEVEYQVTGVIEAPRGKSHLSKVNMLVRYNEFSPYWTGAQTMIYAKLHSEATAENVGQKITDLANRNIRQEYLDAGESLPDKFPLWKLQPFADVHLKSVKIGGYSGDKGDIRQISLLALLSFVVLLIAGINYMNLSTARATQRSKEVGIRKVAGASRLHTITQFMMEALLQSTIAMLGAILITDLTLPLFSELVNRELNLEMITQGVLPFALVGLTLFTGLLAGSYPAFYLSRFKAIVTMKGTAFSGKGGSKLRQGLVVLQFTLSIALIILVGFIWKQVNYMQNQELGFNDQQVIVANINTEQAAEKIRQSRSRIENIPGVEHFSLVADLPGTSFSSYDMHIQGIEKSPSVDIFFADPELAETLELDMIDGRYLSVDLPTDRTNSFVVNERFVKEYQIENPVGHRMKFAFDETYGEIVGVVKDFHFTGLQSAMTPLVISAREDLPWYGNVAIKVEANQMSQVLDELKTTWASIEPVHPFRYSFLDEDFARQYDSFTRFGQTVLMVTILSIIIAIMGLFGLSTFMVERRTKEIGVRKVLGAPVASLVNLLVKEFVLLVFIAGLLALPISYYLVQDWLADFAYRTPVGVFPFALAILSALLLTLLTVSIQAYKSSIANPVRALRYE